MSKSKNYYEILQVQYNADKEVIEAAYKKLCKKYHPDVCGEKDAKKMIVQLNLAYETLKDSKLRNEYNETKLHGYDFNHLNDEIISSKKIMLSYMQYLKSEQYENAYNLIAKVDKKNITLEKFIEWQEEVSSIYSIGNYSIEFFKKHENYHTKKKKRMVAYEFDISIREKKVKDNTIQSFSFSKIVVKEKDNFQVLLDYEEIDSLINKFYLMSIKEKNQISTKKDILNYNQFVSVVQLEAERYRRHGRDFSLIMILINETNTKDTIYKKYYSNTLDIILTSIRLGDYVGLFKKNIIMVLLPETKLIGAKKAFENIRKKLKKDEQIKKAIKKYKFSVCEHEGENYYETILRCFNSFKKKI